MDEQMEREPNSVGFWRRNQIMGLKAEPRWYCMPRDPEEKERWEQESSELAVLQAFEARVLARYRQMKARVEAIEVFAPKPGKPIVDTFTGASIVISSLNSIEPSTSDDLERGWAADPF